MDYKILSDLVLLHDISEDAAVEALSTRFKHELIYTYIGPVLVVVSAHILPPCICDRFLTRL